MRIGILGAGGIGGYLAATLGRAGADLAVIARGNHGAAIARNGLTMHGPKGTNVTRPALVTDDPGRAGPCDLVVIGVKAHQLSDAIEAARPMVGAHGVVTSFQNGIDAPAMLADAFGASRSLIGVARIFVNITGPGEITLRPGPQTFILGDIDGGQASPGAAASLSLFRDAGIDAPDCADVRVELWTKFLLFNAVSSTTAGARTTLGVVRETPELWKLFTDLVRETDAVARASGVALPGDAVERTLATARQVPAEARASTAHDLEQGRALEIDWICGAVARLGTEYSIDVPASRAVLALLAPWRNGMPARGGSR